MNGPLSLPVCLCVCFPLLNPATLHAAQVQCLIILGHQDYKRVSQSSLVLRGCRIAARTQYLEALRSCCVFSLVKRTKKTHRSKIAVIKFNSHPKSQQERSKNASQLSDELASGVHSSHALTKHNTSNSCSIQGCQVSNCVY